MHQRRVHERPRPGSQRLPRRDHRPALAHPVPLQPAGVLPRVSRFGPRWREVTRMEDVIHFALSVSIRVERAVKLRFCRFAH